MKIAPGGVTPDAWLSLEFHDGIEESHLNIEGTD
jgi:hypothetical protein